jgi:hypothetical protein
MEFKKNTTDVLKRHLFTSTNWAIRTKMTKKTGAIIELTQQLVRQSLESSQSSRNVS